MDLIRTFRKDYVRSNNIRWKGENVAYLIAHFPDHYRAYIAGAALQRQLAGPIRVSYIQHSPSASSEPEAGNAVANATFEPQSMHNQTNSSTQEGSTLAFPKEAKNQLRAAGIEDSEASHLAQRLQEQGGSLMLVQLSHRGQARPLLLQMGALEVMQYG